MTIALDPGTVVVEDRPAFTCASGACARATRCARWLHVFLIADGVAVAGADRRRGLLVVPAVLARRRSKGIFSLARTRSRCRTTATPGRRASMAHALLEHDVHRDPVARPHPRRCRAWWPSRVSRFSWRFNIMLLLLFTAGNLLPPQVIFQPLFQMYKRDAVARLPERHQHRQPARHARSRVIIIHVAFQTGFCTFVLSNYMKTIPKEISEAAMVDGAGVLRQFWQVVHAVVPAGARRAGDAASSPGCTTTSSGRRAAATRATSGRSRRRSPTSAGSSSPTTTSIAAGVDDHRPPHAGRVPRSCRRTSSAA